MTKIKIISEIGGRQLEHSVNNWLNTLTEKQSVVDIRVTAYGVSHITGWCMAVITYKTHEENQ
jgi:hypothetical protein